MAINTGNSIFITNGYDENMNGVVGADGRAYRSYIARGKLTNELQNDIPLILNRNSPNSSIASFERPLKLPVGSWITRIDFKLPVTRREGNELIYGIEIPETTEIVGTTGEILKVAFDSEVANTSPAITCADNKYTPGDEATLFRPPWLTDQASPSLVRQVSTEGNLKLRVTNAANTALGTGIRLSTNTTAYIYVIAVVMEIGRGIAPYSYDLPPVPLDLSSIDL